MARVPLIARDVLDPRAAEAADAAPIVGAVNIPFAELPRRVHELPPRDRILRVAGPPELGRTVVAWLRTMGRAAVLAELRDGGSQAVRADGGAAAEGPAPTIGRLWEPNPFLAEVAPQLAPGRALDLACGTGRDAVFLASLGWHVTGVDVLPDALARAAELAERCAAAIEPIRWRCVDLEAAPPPELGGPFDLIISVRYLHRPLLPRLRDWLAPGGQVMIETYTTVHRARHGKPARDAHILQPGELPTLLAGLRIRHHSEDWRGAAHLARVWGEEQ